MRQEYLELGMVVGTHGLQGELRVNPSCDSPAFCCQFACLYFDNLGALPVRVVSARPHQRIALLKLEGTTSVEAAQALRSKTLFFRREDARLEDGQYFIAELLGCTVVDAHNGALCYGTLCDVSKTGANDVWHIRRPNGQQALIPVIASVVKDVDICAGVIQITPLPGLL
jgi:16S rRNA processing protein RimM